ncbi:MAG: FISUMP domain-containing protein, partial [Ignavibacteriaceae bacterium]|nr:FISUMP domain-containing protein [Ignavibacteriaceae bacterium]
MKYFYLFFSLLFASISYSQAPCPGLDSINYSGQWYHTVQIGSQCWLKENLNVGIMKPAIKDQTNNDTIEKFCYNNDSNNCNVYGGLYQWRETMQYSQKIGARGICPIGWHVPLSSEFDSLISMVHEDGNTLKEIGQGGGTNMSGFSGLLSGLSKFSSFSNLGNGSYFWSDSMVHIDVIGRSLILYADNLDLESDNLIKRGANFYDGVQGLSVRCVKDNIGLLLQSPYGGESWQVGSIHSISWGGNNLPNTKIKIEYSTDNGISWLQIIDSVPALDGNYNWIVPNTLSKNCKVRITDLNNPTSFSISDNVFTIYITCPGGSTIEHGGQIYNTVLIGNQCWLKENLNIGKMIPGVQEAYLNGIIEKYCYNDDTANCTIYGGLYKYTEMQEQGICPTFWHISGLSSLANNVSYDANVLKAKGQGSGFGEGTNASGFSALLAGLRNMNDGTFSYLGIYGWFLKGHSDNFVYNDYLESSDSYLFESEEFGNDGGSLRCVRDDVGPLLLKSPVGGENWQIGSNQKIIWTLSEVINIRIDYTTDNGSNWINIISSIPTSAGSFNWTIPNTPSTNCR